MKKILIMSLILLLTSCLSSQFVYTWYPIPCGTTNNLNYINNTWPVNLIVGSSGTILSSTNYGYTWTARNSGTNNDLRSFIQFGSIFVTGTNGTILKSTNNGLTWVQLNSGTVQTLNSISSIYFATLISAGNLGTILSSSNQGATWTAIPSGTTVNLNSIAAAGQHAWIAGNNGLILATTNSGANWTTQSSGVTSNLNYVLSLNNSDSLWIVGDYGKILYSVNGGVNWISVPSGTTSNLKSISVNYPNSWVFGSGGTVLESMNNGLTWSIQSNFTHQNLNSGRSGIGEGGCVVGDNGTIFLRTIDSLRFPQVYLSSNNISSSLYYSGIIDQNLITLNVPGFEWPKGTGEFAIFSAGLTIAAKVNGQLRMASEFFKGECRPGYILDSAGIPVVKTDSLFRFWKVKRSDNLFNSFDWAHWEQIVPYGAPFVDVNHNGIYEPSIDTPGIRNAAQTIFICLTDGFPQFHNPYEGFGGGTLPLYAETHMTAWCYDAPDLMDVQFIKWDIINKSYNSWSSAYFSLTTDPDLGCGNDDYVGCDTTRNLGFCYNGNDVDCQGPYRYPDIVPSVGFVWLRCNNIQNMGLTSCVWFGMPGLACETDPYPAGADLAYNYMRGFKKDGTPWVIPPGGQQNTTKFCYSGDPESESGWCEAESSISGSIQNCGGPNVFTGPFVAANTPGDRRLVLSSGSDNLTINPGDTQKVMIAQLIAKGSNRKNSVTRLKILADTVKAVCSRGMLIGLEQISSNVPNEFFLFQNYPNPFNPNTNIKYQIAKNSFVKLTIYDVIGREVQTLVNEKQNAGTYRIDWSAAGGGNNFASGVYFYKLEAGGFEQTRKMVLIK